MSTIIYSDGSGYRESASGYGDANANIVLASHRSKDVLDHPDGCVTYDKLSGDVKDYIAEIDTNAVTAKTNAISANETAIQAKEAIVNMTVSSDMLLSTEQATATITEQDRAINIHFGIPKGEKGTDGNDGHTPEKGVDYFTEADVGDIVAKVTENLSAQYGDIETALGELHTYAQSLTGGESV